MSLTADQATTILNAMAIPSLKAEHPVTKRVIAAIPDDRVDYRPDTIVKSAIDLAWHIVTAENRFLEAIIAGAFDLTPRPRPEPFLGYRGAGPPAPHTRTNSSSE